MENFKRQWNLNHIAVTNNSVVLWQTDVGNEEQKNLLSWQSIRIFVLAARLQDIYIKKAHLEAFHGAISGICLSFSNI